MEKIWEGKGKYGTPLLAQNDANVGFMSGYTKNSGLIVRHPNSFDLACDV